LARSAVLDTFCPAFSTSCPKPCTVLQAQSRPAKVMSAAILVIFFMGFSVFVASTVEARAL
jgi:hypothetical protein